MLKKWDLGRTDGNVILPFSGSLLTTGTYLLRIDAGNKTQSFKLIKQ
ncbi:MAG: T9SS type A sorting domain-containing protein [Chitinophagaceae bacterium]|nr:T9SS type A sorting domain-containing protein [Chitinophagaceae bacterium]